MRRWLFILLLLGMPLQAVWASAAPYCGHEADSSPTKHFGHHEHRHQAGGDIAPALDDLGNAPDAYHADCASCHLGCSATPAVATVAIQAQPQGVTPLFDDPRYASHIPCGPERPDRSRPTPAVRFGGAVVSGSLHS